MARYKPYDVHQDKFIPVSFRDQILLGFFEYALNEIVDRHIDLAPFEARYANDQTGRLAYDPAVLLKIVLYGYYKGIVSSRKLAEGCERHVVFLALSADTRPHFTKGRCAIRPRCAGYLHVARRTTRDSYGERDC
jgi:hypothetical protein